MRGGLFRNRADSFGSQSVFTTKRPFPHQQRDGLSAVESALRPLPASVLMRIEMFKDARVESPVTGTDSVSATSPLSPVPGLAPPQIPDHELLRRIGQGSYGEVWLARSVMGAYRAVKIVYRRSFGDNRPFEREFEGIQRYEPISRSHETQVQILHVGLNAAEGYFYYVMELADDAGTQRSDGVMEYGSRGQTLPTQHSNTPTLQDPSSYAPHTLRHDLRTHGRLPIPQCVEIGLALTDALAHLHKHKLIHRDIKPSNIIFVNGRPKLADIGLVTDTGDACSIVGTEGYLAPEGPGTPQADLYSLGKVLYEISTGRDRRHFPDLDLRRVCTHR
ncbi:MAG: hypothetical protein DME26_09290 [Verrucomicrobia bacterium]|nr:MAG: hypothetical protein DME26_09290 [Verrucomicrobiota bacterium]